jgi:hypothetical protein
MEHNHSNGDAAGCEICQHNLPFDLPAELIDDIKEGKVVIFAGAGVSTENHSVFQDSFYELICHEIGISPQNGPSFPDLMSMYCTKRNGRTLLLQKIKQRFDYAKSFPEIYRSATQFHKELATLYFINTIITTNWDDYFENECGAMPIVVAEDFAFWDMPGRKVYKIHGSVNSYSSIIASREDYENCYKRLTSGLLGSYLKVMLAIKTIVYIGFSFRDDDFLRIYKLLSEEMGAIHPCSYVVTIDKASDARFKELGLIPIYTNGEYFIKNIKIELVNRKLILDDMEFVSVESLLIVVRELHIKMGQEIVLFEQPDSVYLLSYQDGLIHSLERIVALRKTGYYSNPENTHLSIDSYLRKRKEYMSARRYFDVAYIDGYIDGLIYLIADDEVRETFSPFYIFGYKGEIRDLEQYKQIILDASQIHLTAHRLAINIVKKRVFGKDIVVHHPPFL